MNKNPIWFFDSWIWWKTILEETIKLLPNENYIYYADNLNNPYWDKTNKEILNLTIKWIEYLLSKNCKTIVLACNTATAVCIKELRKRYKIPIIGTEPALKLAMKLNNSDKVVWVMATPATIKSEKFLNIYYLYDRKNIVLLPCPNLANLIENNEENKIDNYLNELFYYHKNLDIIVLGCTHFPYIKDNIKKILPQIEFIDWNEWISKQIKNILIENQLQNTTNKKWQVEEYKTYNNF